jgi:pyridoxal phosphate enzyme (YggS family)
LALPMASIAENISSVRQQIRDAATQYVRAETSVTLLAVSKTQSADKVRQAFDANQRHFGENYVQEGLEKIQSLQLNGLVWHFIGPIQSNKTRDIATHFDWVHSVDRAKIAQRLNDQRPKEQDPLNLCIQVNISEESTKSGVALKDAEALCEQLIQLPNIRLRGLMAIPAPCADLQQQRSAFKPLKALFERLRGRFEHFDTLSIGMSNDIEAAIAEGSTMVRVGSAIFGVREPKQKE